MKRSLRSVWIVAALLSAATVAIKTDAGMQLSKEAAFAAENDAAMSKMMKAMHVEPSGNIDRDFAIMMIPHHQGAIDMARAELRYGSNERLRRLAQEIVVAQQQEITVMKTVVDEELPLPPTVKTYHH